MVYDHESMRGDLRSATHVRPYICSHGYFRIRTLGQSATEGIDGLGAVRFATMGLDRAFLLGKLSCCAWTCLKAEAVRLLGREDVVPGMIGAIQTHGELLHWHPHIHVLVTCGEFTPEGDFLELPQFDMERLLVAWQEAVFALYLAEETYVDIDTFLASF
jgi:hypothetical protein